MARPCVPKASVARFAVVTAAVGLALAGCGGSGAEGRAGTPLSARNGCPLQGTSNPRGDRLNATRLVGMTFPQAIRAARVHGCVVRAVKINGREQVVTRDARTNRIDVAIDRSQRVVAFEGIY